MAIGPFDRVALEMDRRWGVDRLSELVSPNMAQKFGAALAFLNECIDANDPTAVASAAANCIKGMNAMDAEALALGRVPVPADVWIVEMDGRKFGIIREAGDWATLQADHPGMTLFSAREAAIALLAYRAAVPALEAVQAHFPAAKISAIRPLTKLEEEIGDHIPF